MSFLKFHCLDISGFLKFQRLMPVYAAGLSYINFIYILQHKNLYLGLVKWTKNMYYNQVV